MPLPLLIGIGAALAGASEIGLGVRGAIKFKNAKKTLNSASERHTNNHRLFDEDAKLTSETMDLLGKKELEIFQSFDVF
jgi:hypothetical protein